MSYNRFKFSPLKGDVRLQSLDVIGSIVADKYNISLDLLKSKTRVQNIKEARQIAVYIACGLTKFTIASIGEHYNIHHATVIHSRKTIKNLCDTEPALKLLVDDLIVECKHNLTLDREETHDKFKHTIHLDSSKALILIGFNTKEIEVFKVHNSL